MTANPARMRMYLPLAMSLRLMVTVIEPVPTTVTSRVTIRLRKPRVSMSGLVCVVVRDADGRRVWYTDIRITSLVAADAKCIPERRAQSHEDQDGRVRISASPFGDGQPLKLERQRLVDAADQQSRREDGRDNPHPHPPRAFLASGAATSA